MTAPPPGPDAAAERGAAAPPLVLVVDDSEKNLKLARDVLRGAGLRTLEAANGAEALALARDHLPDVILLDLQLPDLDGTVVARKLADSAETESIPIVALSAQRLDASADWVRSAGFAGYLEKPIHVETFPDRVLAYCSDTPE